ncbi:MAG: ABC transporter ATP-binding protein [Firmicutes bacterium]|nr:ABC transporter ATP-binding protein [Bacillota bacterium]
MIELNGIIKIYKTGAEDFYALKDVDLRIDDGEFISVCGASGSGKTTLLNIIGLLDSFDGGSYKLNGIDIKEQKDKELSRIRNEEIGFVLQDFALIDHQTVLYNVMLPLLFSKVPFGEIRDLAEGALESVGLKNQTKKKANQLSGGQRQRVAIARALVNEPSIILADEPTGQLDTVTSGQIIDLLKSINEKGKTVIIVTHDPKIASSGQRLITISDGKIISE